MDIEEGYTEVVAVPVVKEVVPAVVVLWLIELVA